MDKTTQQLADALEAAGEALAAFDAASREPVRILISLEGGLVTGVLTEGDTPTEVLIIDYDYEGADEDEITAVPQDDGGLADAVCSQRAVTHDPAFIARAFAACAGASEYAIRVAELEANGMTTSDAQAVADAEGLED